MGKSHTKSQIFRAKDVNLYVKSQIKSLITSPYHTLFLAQISTQILNHILITFKVSEIVKVPLGENTVHQTVITQKQSNMHGIIAQVPLK